MRLINQILLIFSLFIYLSTSDVTTTIDDFGDDQTLLTIVFTGTSTITITESSVTGDGIIGSERDIQLTAFASTSENATILTQVTENAWTTSFPSGAFGSSMLQYDGADDSPLLSLSPGLGGTDFTGDSDSLFLRLSLSTTTSFTINIYGESNDTISSYTFDVEPAVNGTDTEVIIPFSNFTGSASFASVNAIELVLNVPVTTPDGGIESSVKLFSFYNNEVFTASGSVFEDCNENGIVDSGEVRYSGIEVVLSNAADNFTQLTDQEGFFLFTDVPPGSYSACVVIDVNAQPTLPANGCQTIIITDTDVSDINFGVLPELIITAPSNVSIDCGDCSTPNCTGEAIFATCNNTEPIDFSDSSEGECPTIITRTFTSAGREPVVQTITVNDNTAPTITTEAMDQTYGCLSDRSTKFDDWIDNNGGAIAVDSCTSNLFWTHNFTGSSPSDCPSTTTVIFTVTDDCGNSADTTATFFISEDSPSPVTSPSPVESPSPITSPSPVTSPSPATSPSTVTLSPAVSPTPVSPATSPTSVSSITPSRSQTPVISNPSMGVNITKTNFANQTVSGDVDPENGTLVLDDTVESDNVVGGTQQATAEITNSQEGTVNITINDGEWTSTVPAGSEAVIQLIFDAGGEGLHNSGAEVAPPNALDVIINIPIESIDIDESTNATLEIIITSGNEAKKRVVTVARGQVRLQSTPRGYSFSLNNDLTAKVDLKTIQSITLAIIIDDSANTNSAGESLSITVAPITFISIVRVTPTRSPIPASPSQTPTRNLPPTQTRTPNAAASATRTPIHGSRSHTRTRAARPSAKPDESNSSNFISISFSVLLCLFCLLF